MFRINLKTTCKLFAICTVTVGLMESCQVDSRYNAENLKDADLSVTLFEKGIEFPIGELEAITAEDLGLKTFNSRYNESAALDIEGTLLDAIDKIGGQTHSCDVVYGLSSLENILPPSGILSGDIQVEDLKINLEGKIELVILGSEEIPEELSRVDLISFSGGSVRFRATFTGLPVLKEGSYTVDLKASLPEFFNPSEITIRGLLDENASISSETIEIKSIGGLEIKDEEGLTFPIELSGTATVNGILDSSKALPESMTVTYDTSFQNLKVDRISAGLGIEIREEYQFQTNLLEGFEGITADLDLKGATLLVEISSNADIAATGGLVILTENQKNGNQKSWGIEDIHIPSSSDPSNPATIRYCITADKADCPEGYEYRRADINYLLRDLPESAAICLFGLSDSERTSSITIGQNYAITVDCTVNIPIEAGPELMVSTSRELEIGSEIKDALKMGAIGLRGSFQNDIPLAATIDLEFIDSEGSVIDLNSESGQVEIPFGESRSELLIRPRNTDLIDRIAKLKLNFTLTDAGAGRPVNDDDAITGRLSAFLPDGITINIKEK